MAGRILFFDGISANRIVLRCKLSAACYTVDQAADYATLPVLAAATPPDAVIVDLDHDPDAARATCARLVAMLDPDGGTVIGAMRGSDPERRRRALRAGAATVIAKPFHEGHVMACLRKALRDRQTLRGDGEQAEAVRDLGLLEVPAFQARPAQLILLNDGAAAAEVHRRVARLREHLPTVGVSAPPVDAGLAAPDACILTIPAAEPSRGFRTLSELRTRFATAGTRIIVVIDGQPAGAAPDFDLAAMALDIGADDVLPHGFDAEEIALRVAHNLARKRAHDCLKDSLTAGMRLAARDPLTGLYNRRYAMERLSRMMRTAAKQSEDLALLAVDIDRFKRINDAFGHAAGDAVLTDVARRLSEPLSPRDFIARSGGEEFWIALPQTSSAGATAMAQTLCTRLRTDPVSLGCQAAPIRVTASIGIAMAGLGAGNRDTVDGLLRRADAALYAAKRGGRDTVTMADCAA